MEPFLTELYREFIRALSEKHPESVIPTANHHKFAPKSFFLDSFSDYANRYVLFA